MAVVALVGYGFAPGLLAVLILLVIAAAVIFGGTMAPMVSDAMGLGALSVGPQYFNPSFFEMAKASCTLKPRRE